MTEEPVTVHVGLTGHIDHGKTALAAALSEGVFTAGLDRHPQARQRGMTIDLGFTMFHLGDYVVTLVDAPGHADLIRSVVAGASIIDMAILTVAADEGPKVQTGEHLVVLDSMGISSLLVAITKIDLVGREQVERVERQMRSILSDLSFDDVRFVRVSAKTREGLDELRQTLLDMLRPRPRDRDGPFLMPIDHAFPVRGHGTVVTGTILRGCISSDNLVELAPQGLRARVRTIQTFGQSRKAACAGDRVGINVPDLDHRDIVRGYYLCQPHSLANSPQFLVRLQRTRLYSGRVTSGMRLSAHVGMRAVTCEVIPLVEIEGRLVLCEEAEDEEFLAVLRSSRPIAIEPGMRVLLLRTDLPPTTMRIVASGAVRWTTSPTTVYRRTVRRGTVHRLREADVLVVGLATRRERALQLRGLRVRAAGGAVGTIGEPFGTKGVVSISFDSPVTEGEEVYLDVFREVRLGG